MKFHTTVSLFFRLSCTVECLCTLCNDKGIHSLFLHRGYISLISDALGSHISVSQQADGLKADLRKALPINLFFFFLHHKLFFSSVLHQNTFLKASNNLEFRKKSEVST